VVLFDEIEKAHQEVFNTLLQLLDDGRLTDGQGRTVDFRNTVVIMTSNVGSQAWSGMGEEDDQKAALKFSREALKATFRPEFLNRVDEIVDFHPLTREQIREIVGIQLNHVENLVRDRGYSLEVSEEAQDYLAEQGFDPDYGARPLKRTIQKQLQDPLALAMLSGKFKVGDTIRVEAGKDRLEFSDILTGEVVA